MHRRRFLTATTALAGTSLAGCANTQWGSGDGSTPTPDDDSTLSAGDYTATLSDPRVRPSIRNGAVHLDVYDEQDAQFLVFGVSTDGAELDELPLSLRADGSTVDDAPMLVGRPENEYDVEGAFTVPHGTYGSAEVVLEADGETDSWSVTSDLVDAFGRPPDFTVESLDVPDSIPEVQAFEASFTVSNGGDREARFLAEFGHGLISDTGEAELTIPPGEQRTHTEEIDPPDGDYESIPVILDWGLVHRRVEVTVESG